MNTYPSTYIAVDFETTGLSSQYDSPTALALVMFEGGEPTGEMCHVRIKPSIKTKLSLEAYAVQSGGIEAFDPDKVADAIRKLFPADAMPMTEAMTEVAKWCKEVGAPHIPNVAQKASFDWAFWDDKMMLCTKSYSGSVLSPAWYCTKAMARAVWPDMKSVSLAPIAIACGLEAETGRQHEAVYDAILCGKVYWKLRELLLGEPCEARR